jgi:TolA-binding protein
VSLFLVSFLPGQSGDVEKEPVGQPLPVTSQGEDLESRLSLKWRILAADRALKVGLPLAVNLIRDLLETGVLTSDERVGLYLDLAQAQIASGRGDQAASVLRDLVTSGYPLLPGQEADFQALTAIVAYQVGDLDTSRGALDELDPGESGADLRPWISLTRGLLAEEDEDFRGANQYYLQALAESTNTFQRATLNSVIQRNRLLTGEDSPELQESLRELLEEAEGTRIAAQYVEQLSIALFRSGQEAEALAVLEAQIEGTRPENADQLDRLYYLVAILAEGRPGQRQSAFEWILSSGQARGYLEMALRNLMLLASNSGREIELLRFLTDLEARKTGHPLRGEILFSMAVLSNQVGDQLGARESLDRILSEIPGSPYAIEALRFLAFLALENKAYRTAAGHFTQLRDALPAGGERNDASLYLADCYFINGDFETAASAYVALLPQIESGELKEVVLYQRVMATMGAGNLQAAITSLDAVPAPASPVGQALRWQAEWNLAVELRSQDRAEAAYARMAAIGESIAFSRMALPLRLRLLWLEGVLALESGNASEIPELADLILDTLVSAQEIGLDSEILLEIEARTLLLKGQALLGISYGDVGQPGLSPEAEEGLALFGDLRDRFGETEAAELSLFEEARFFAGLGRAVDAQQRYLELSRDPDSRFAPIALYEAAINAANLLAMENPETINLEEAEPVRLLRQLTEEYGENRELFFYARLKQGDIARDLGRFGIARGIYESLITAFPEHPERYLPELGRADSILALSTGNPDQLAEAITAYERLMERSDLPLDLRAEAGNKMAFALNRQGNQERSKSIYYQTLTRFLLDESVAQRLGTSGRYWLSRSALELGQLFEEEGDLTSAGDIYQAILDYQLPGRALASANLDRLGRPRVGAPTASNP